MEKLIEFLLEQFHLSTVFAVASFSVDALFFPAGLPSPLVAFLTGVAALMAARWLKNRRFFVERSLKNIEQLVTQQRLTPEQGAYYKQRIIEKWLEHTKGIPPQAEARQLPPKPEE